MKLSITLPADLVAEVRDAAADSGLGVSGVIAAALRQVLAAAQPGTPRRALALDAEDNQAWAEDALALTAAPGRSSSGRHRSRRAAARAATGRHPFIAFPTRAAMSCAARTPRWSSRANECDGPARHRRADDQLLAFCRRSPAYLVAVTGSESGLDRDGFVKCDQPATLPVAVLGRRRGRLAPGVVEQLEVALRFVLEL